MATRHCTLSSRTSSLSSNGLSLGLALGLFGLLGTAGCGGGGTDAAVANAQTFSIQSVSLSPSETNYQLNRPITIRFNRPLDFASVTPNTINVSVSAGEMIEDPTAPGEMLAVGGLPAIGEYMLVDDRTVLFQPACPTLDDLSNSGFLRGVEYTLNIPAQSTNGIALGAMGDGAGLTSSFTVRFRTSDSQDLSQLFLDTVVEPPAPIVRLAGSADAATLRLEVGGDAANPVYLERTPFGGTGTPPVGFEAPLNLYSDPATRVDVMLVMNQPVNPSTLNIDNSRLRLEFMLSAGPDVWQDFPADVVLERNCTATGAEIRMIPLGPFPQDRPMRVIIEPEFEDLIGQRNQGALIDFASFMTSRALDPGTMAAGDGADEIFEPFTVGGSAPGSLEDNLASFSVPRAPWNKDNEGTLSAAFSFEGTGGPGGTFDLLIPAGASADFNSESQQFQGGPMFVPTETQVAVNGILNVRDLTIGAGASWRVRGSKPITILASGDVRIDGVLSANGTGGNPIFTLNTANLPEPGGAGVGGGGTGGTGSSLTTQSTPRGGAGFGGITFAASGGGGGGESGIATNSVNSGENRRPGGGGGGVLGHDTVLADGCGNEDYIGLNAETGHLGAPTARGATTNVSPPQGGVVGPGPFSDPFDDNDFWGTMLVDPGGPSQRTIEGELSTPWAGAGGGGGGDGTDYNASIGYPDPNFPVSREDKGAGGGGGGGSITILALGSITFGPGGRIEANGGTGAGGENTSFVNRVGGGSGGGSGGHIILQSGKFIDFSEVPSSTSICFNNFNCLSLMALGGQGGVGSGNGGGFDPNNGASGNPNSDSKPASMGNEGVVCTAVPRLCAGGDGGPGIIQLHTESLSDIIPPQAGADGNMRNISRPSPLGMNNETGMWDAQMLPAFGRISRAQSKWIPLGAMRVAPGTSVPESIEYLFDGIDPMTGLVETTLGIVDPLPAVVAGALTAPGGFPYVDADGVTIVFDVTDLAGANDIYRRNPNLTRLFELTLTNGGTTAVFEVESATTDEVAGELRLTLGESANGLALGDFSIGDMATLTPRFFGVSTSGIKNFLPASASIKVSFQAAPEAIVGGPDELNATPLTSDISMLTNPMLPALNTDFRFIRFVVEFDIAADMSDPSFASPIPSLDFLRIPFRF